MNAVQTDSMTPLLNLLRAAGATFILLAPPLLLLFAIDESPVQPTLDFFLWSHALLELLAIAIAICIFFVGWNILDDSRPRASLWLACAFLSVAMFDAAHLLSYQGMPDFITANTPQKTITFWLMARLIAAVALLLYVATSSLSPPVHESPARYRYLFVTLALTAGLWLFVMTAAQVLPTFYSIDSGFSGAKVALEGLVVTLHLATLMAIWIKRRQLPLTSPAALVMAVLLVTAAECFFLVNNQIQQASSLVGHIYKVLAYAYLYRAMFLDSVRLPVQRLQAAHQTLSRYSEQLDELLNNAPDGIMGVDRHGRIQFVNPSLINMFGFSENELIGQSVEVLLPMALRERHSTLRDNYLRAPTGRPMSSQRGLVGRHKDGREIPVDIALGKHQSVDGVQITAFIRDVSERHRLERDMQHRATHDMLTGLPNRALMNDRIDRAIAHAKRHDTHFALIMLDLDNFKDINDGWGHSMGDQLLVTVARRMSRALRQGDTVARFGGDEFVILATDLQSIESAQALVEKLTDVLRNAFVIGTQQFYISASIGVALYPDHADDAETLLSHADIAMYRAKNMGRRTACYFDMSMSHDQQESLIVKARLIDAIDQGQLTVHYQPQYSLQDREIIGFEALLRWEDAELGKISPDIFIPIAEANGLIITLTEFVISEACEQIASWRELGFRMRISVNISALHFRHQGVLVSFIEEQLTRYRIEPTLLGLELTESALMHNADIVADTLRQLVAMGIHISIDDFGTGYSSLASLQLFPLHTLKIDRSFMRDLAADEKKAAIIAGLINLAGSLGLEVMAEGVETLEQYQILRTHHCSSMQGWLMSPALPARDCTGLLLKRLDAGQASIVVNGRVG